MPLELQQNLKVSQNTRLISLFILSDFANLFVLVSMTTFSNIELLY